MEIQSLAGVLLGSCLMSLSVFLSVVLITPLWDKFSENYFVQMSQRFRALGMSILHLRLILRFWGICMVGLVVAGFVIQAIPIGLGFAVLLTTVPAHILKFLIQRRESKLRDQLVQASKSIANSVRVGLSLKQSFESVTADTASPLRQEFQRIVFDTNHGRPLVEVLNDVRARLNVDAFSLFAAAISVNLDRGGPLNNSLERISISLQESQRLERKLAADTSSGRQMLIILALFPLFFLVLFGVLDPSGISLLIRTLLGQWILVAVGVTVYGGVQWGRRIMSIEL